MSLNHSRSRQAKVASLARQARVAEAANRIPEAITLLRDAVHLDPHDPRTLHWLGDLFRIRLNRLAEAATWYAREARAHERDDLPARALAAWRIVLVCSSLHVEAHERIGALYAEARRLADARQHYERSERVLREAGLGREAAVLRAQREALEEPSPVAGAASPAPATAAAVAAAPPSPGPDDDPDPEVVAYVEERLSNGRLFHHYGLHAEARRLLEELLASAPEHVEARQLVAEACRALGDAEAAADHLRLLVHVLRRRGEAEVPEGGDPVALLPIEEWVPEEEQETGPLASPVPDPDPFAALLDEIRGDVERLVGRLQPRKEVE